jgi:4-hydroxy-tetrahydrodipicolinate synthase
MKIAGVWLPVITPFLNDEIDFVSYQRLIDYYIPKGISGIIANGTTGESPALSESEFEALANKTVEFTRGRVPVYFGVGGNYTKEVIHKLKIAEKTGIDGILSVGPYYNRPDQRGIYEHFKMLSESTSLPVILYNIPYRTGRNMENDTILKLAELKNIVAIKDASGNINQSLELLLNKPAGFSVLTGEDNLFFTSLAHGADGGILASSHIYTESFMEVYYMMKDNDARLALQTWNQLARIIPLLFKEPNPAPLKYILHQQNLIRSGELRLPLVDISANLKMEINKAMGFQPQAVNPGLITSSVN